MILYGGPASPFVRKTRITVIELGLAERVEVVITRPAARADIIPRHNQLGKIPVLIKEDGEAVYDSAVICEYLDTFGNSSDLFAIKETESWRLSRLHALGDGVAEAAVNIGVENRRPPDKKFDDYVERQLNKINLGTAALAEETILYGTSLNIGQIAAACGLGQVDFLDLDPDWRRRNPNLADWFALLSERPSFAETKPERNPA